MTELVVVTGADGFIGSHLVEELVARGHRVRALILYNSFGSHGWLDDLPPEVLREVEVVLGDVRDPHCMLALLDGAQVAYHLAALVGVPYSYRAPRSYTDTNVMGTLNVLQAARAAGTPRVVHTSTSEVYGTPGFVPVSEDHPARAQSPYAATKIAADALVESFRCSYELPVVTLRPFNTYGPRQSTRAVIPAIISQLGAHADVVHLGALNPTRDFIFVKDTVSAFITVGTASASSVLGEVFNAGTGRECSVGQLADVIATIMGRPLALEADPTRMRPDTSEVQRLVCDASKLRRQTVWHPYYGLEEGLQATIDWFGSGSYVGRFDADRLM
ncbi:MAG: GDP-mannose 4,6-dehydratase [Pseudonocardiaceae bacterium]